MSKERFGLMVVFPCHCVFDHSRDCIYAEHPEDRPIYESQLAYTFKHLIWRRALDPLLILSGAPTKREVEYSESRTNVELAKANNLPLPQNVALEEYALTSIDNLVLSLFVYHMLRNAYPQTIDVISWGFKRERFEATLDAINTWSRFGESWASLNFFPVGDLWGAPKQGALAVEREYITSLESGLEAYYANPITEGRVRQRDVHQSRSKAKEFYYRYPVPF